MNRSRLLTLVLLCALVPFRFVAAQDSDKNKKVVVGPPMALGNSGDTGSTMTATLFNTIARQGLKVADPKYGGAVVTGFSFTYGEHNVYEDSAGNFMGVIDYLTEYCPGDTLTVAIAASLIDRTKAGDTAYFDDIHLRLADGKTMIGKPLKIAIVR